MFLTLALQAHANGYSPIPVNGKRPILKKWQRGCSTQFSACELEEHLGRNFGLCSGYGGLVAIDLDIDDEELAARAQALAEQLLGTGALVRFGRFPRRVLLYRTSEPVKSTAKKYQKGGVDILADGKQVVAFGIHPTTLQPYTWRNNRSPATVPAGELPRIECSQIVKYVDNLELILGAPVKSASTKRLSRPKTLRDVPSEYNFALVGSAEEVLQRLNALASANLEAWVYGLGLDNLHRVGQHFEARASFRNGQHEGSLRIRPESIYDFGTNRGYYPIGLVQHALGITFRQAVEWLDARVGPGGVFSEWMRRKSIERPVLADVGVPTSAPAKKPQYRNTARAALASRFADIWMTCERWHENKAGSLPVYGVKAPAGTGKSYAALSAHADYCRRLREAGQRPRLLAYAVPTLSTAAELAERYRGPGQALLLIGQTSDDPISGRPVCDLKHDARAVAAAGASPSLLCKRGSERCPFYDRCEFQSRVRQAQTDTSVEVIVLATASISSDVRALAGLPIFALFLDEVVHPSLVKSIKLQASDLNPIEAKSKDPETLLYERDAAKSLAANTLRGKLQSSILLCSGRKDQLISREDLGISAEEIEAAIAVEAEQRLQHLLRIRPTTEARHRSAAVTGLGRHSAVISVLEALKDSSSWPLVVSRGELAVTVPREAAGWTEDLPTIFADANLLPAEVMRERWPLYHELDPVEMSPGPGSTLIRVAGLSTSKRALGREAGQRMGEVKRVLAGLDFLAPRGSRLLIAPKDHAAELKPDGFNTLTHGRTRGVDRHRNASLVVNVGQPLPPPRAIEALAAAWACRSIERLATESSWYPKDESTGRFCHPDPICNAFLAVASLGEISQALGRGRPGDVGPDRRQWLVSFADCDQTVDVTIEAADFMPTALDAAQLAAGVLFESGTMAAAFARVPHHRNERRFVDTIQRLAALIAPPTANAETRSALKETLTSAERVSACLHGDSRWYAVDYRVKAPGRRGSPARAWALATSPSDAAEKVKVALAAASLEVAAAQPVEIADGSFLTSELLGTVLDKPVTTDNLADWERDSSYKPHVGQGNVLEASRQGERLPGAPPMTLPPLWLRIAMEDLPEEMERFRLTKRDILEMAVGLMDDDEAIEATPFGIRIAIYETQRQLRSTGLAKEFDAWPVNGERIS